MARRVSPGGSVRVAVPANTAVAQGEIVALGGFVGIALASVPASDNGGFVVLDIAEGEVETNQIVAADSFAAGSPVYFDAAAKKLTNSEGTGNKKVGVVTKAKDANGVIWFYFAPELSLA